MRKLLPEAFKPYIKPLVELQKNIFGKNIPEGMHMMDMRELNGLQAELFSIFKHKDGINKSLGFVLDEHAYLIPTYKAYVLDGQTEKTNFSMILKAKWNDVAQRLPYREEVWQTTLGSKLPIRVEVEVQTFAGECMTLRARHKEGEAIIVAEINYEQVFAQLADNTKDRLLVAGGAAEIKQDVLQPFRAEAEREALGVGRKTKRSGHGSKKL